MIRPCLRNIKAERLTPFHGLTVTYGANYLAVLDLNRVPYTRMDMKTLGTAAVAALTMAFSGAACADWDDHRRHHYRGDHHRHHGGGHWKHHDRHFHHHHHYRGPAVGYGYYPAPVYVPQPYYAHPPRYHRPHDGVTIILPPVRIGF